MHGLHLIADLTGCPVDCPAVRALMCDAGALRALCVAAVEVAGLRAVGECFHAFDPAEQAGRVTPAGLAGPTGVTGMVLLAESHVAVHTWPELGAVTLDVYVCNRGDDNRARAQALLHALIHAFAPAQTRQQAVMRGDLTAST